MKKIGVKSNNILITYCSMFVGGFLFFLPILALYFEKSLFSITNVAIIFSVEAICFAVFEMPTGAIADLFGRKRTIIAANFMSIVALVFLAIGGSFIMFILYAIINSFARSLMSGTDSAIIYDTLKDENKEFAYKKVIGTYHALWPVGASVSSVIGGYLAAASFKLPIFLTFIPLSISTILAFFLKEPKYEKEIHHNVFKHIINSVKTISKNRQLVILMLGVFILLAFNESMHLLNAIYFEFKEIPIEFFGWISAFVFGFSSLGHYFSHAISEKIGDKKALLLAVFGSPTLLLLSTFFTKWNSIVLFVIPSVFFGLRNPIIDHFLNSEVSSKMRATIISTNNFLGQLGVALFSPLLGYFADLYTINTAFRISAVCLFSVTVLYLFLKRN